jgi:hypothetical protein
MRPLSQWIGPIVFALVIVGKANNLVASEIKPTTAMPIVVRYLELGDLRAVHAFKFELIDRALELTRNEFGDYQKIPYAGADLSQIRYSKLISEGRVLNIAWGSPGTLLAKGEVITIPIDILKGLLGYRICLINGKVPPGIETAYKTGSLSSLKIGSGELWEDKKIYRNNKINIISGTNFTSLFDMLGYQRFDCLPFGADEVQSIYNDRKAQYPFLAIDTQLLIYYEFPTYLYVSKKAPELAQRIQSGLSKMQETGEFERLFKKHHPQDLSLLNLRARKVICLKSPFLDQSEQCSKPLAFPE